MILVHRITPFGIVLVSIAAFASLIYSPFFGMKMLIPATAILALSFSRLLLWEFHRPAFWVFFGTPMLLWVSSLIFFSFLEDPVSKWVIATTVTFGLALYAENVFTFYHLPSAYQAYALENLSLVLYVLSAFFFTSGAFGSQLFLLLPVWIPMLVVFVAVLLATVSVFWVSKIGFETGRPYAIVGAIIMAELYSVLSTWPTSFVTNAATFAVLLYTFLVLSRANVLERLSKKMVVRTLAFASVLLVIILGSARWL